MYFFGSGDAIATPYGSAAAPNPTPIKLGVLQECSADIGFGSKPLMGKGQFPVAVARTAGKISLKFKFANTYAKLWNDLLFGSTLSAGSEVGVVDSVQTVTSHAATITPPGGGTFARMMTVRKGSNGQAMTLVGATPVAGVSYTVAGPVITFAAGETETSVFVTYTYTKTTGYKSTVTNQPMGAQPVFDLTIMNTQWTDPVTGSASGLVRFPNVISNKLTFPFKNEDWMIHEFDCDGFADATGNVIYINADE